MTLDLYNVSYLPFLATQVGFERTQEGEVSAQGTKWCFITATVP